MINFYLFGGERGYGESILIQISENSFGIIDSFQNSNKEIPVLKFLEQNNITTSKIKFVVLTHFHGDHITGMSKILDVCQGAEFYTTSTFGLVSFNILLKYLEKIEFKNNTAKELSHIFKVMKNSGRKIKLLSTNSTIIEENDMKLSAFSPNKLTNEYLDEIYKSDIRNLKGNPNLKMKLGDNAQSIVLTLEGKDFNILFGADLEYIDNSKEKIGWDSVYENVNFNTLNFDIIKVPHHGSENGYKKEDLEKIVNPKTKLTLTPYSRGTKLPQSIMIDNLKQHGKVYCTLNLNEKVYKGLPGKLSKRTKHLNIKRLRKNLNGIIHICKIDGELKVELIDKAVKL